MRRILSFALIASFPIFAHSSLLHLPFYWDEAGQFVPAALDLYRTHLWIPASTVPNVHPPGVMAYLALVWSMFGFSIESTRLAMLVIAAFAALFTFRLGMELNRGSSAVPVFAASSFLCVSPLFFSQSMLAQLDMPAMCLSVLALLLFLRENIRASAMACTALVLIKETGVVAPALFACWLLGERRRREALWFLLPFPGLFIWLFALHHATGYWLGSAYFGAYNFSESLRPAHIFTALLRRIYYLFISSGHAIGTTVLLLAWKRTPLLRSRAWRVAASFVAAQVLIVTVFGGAVLERYLLPALPVLYIAFAAALCALMPGPRAVATAGLFLCLAAANFINPVYPFPFENNLAFVSFVRLEESAANAVELRSAASVATAFPITDALRNQDLGFVTTPRAVVEIQNFSAPEIEKLKAESPDLLVVFDRTWDPLHMLDHSAVRSFLEKYYDYRPEMSAESIAQSLSMRITRRWERRGFTMQLLERL